MKITCGDYWPRDESWWPHVPSEGNKSGDVSGTPRGGTGEVDIQVTSQWHGNRNSSRLQRVFIGESTSVNFCCMKGIKKQLLSKLNQHSSSQLSQEAEMSQSNLPSTMQTHPSIDAELLADWDLAWDYTQGLDLTFLVFFKCKHAHRPTCRGLTPSFEKEVCRSHA